MKLDFDLMEPVNGPAVGDLAKAVGARGFDSTWFGEHNHNPMSRETPNSGVVMPEPYVFIPDHYAALAFAVSATTWLLIGTGLTLVLEHDVFSLAKRAATIGYLSGKWFIMGVGVGSNRDVLANHRTISWSN